MSTKAKVDWPYEFPGAYWLDEQEDNAVLDVLHHGTMFRYYGLGEPKYVDAFERAAKEFYGSKYALGMNSGTGALITAMTAMGIGPGCEVIVPCYLWVATVGAVVQCNAIPVLCEVDESFNMNPEDLEKRITPRTKLIIPIHMRGVPCDMDRIMSIADKHNIPVLEDCAQANGSTYRGKSVGRLGKMAIFSLQMNKNITCGEGGLLITDDERLYFKSFSCHDMGLIRVGGRLATPEPYAVSWGAGRRMTELCGAVASVQMKKLPLIVEHMRNSKNRIKKKLEGTPGIEFRKLPDTEGDSGPFLIMMFADGDKARSVTEKMKAAGLHNACHIAQDGLHNYYNIPSLTGKVSLSLTGNPWSLTENKDSNYDYNKGCCPQSDALFERSVVLAIPSLLTERQEDDAAVAIQEAVS